MVDGNSGDTMDLQNLKIVGTAHVSEKSIKEVRETIRKEKPDIVAVELDEGRFRGLIEREETSLREVLRARDGEVRLLLLQWLLSHIQKKIGKGVGIMPGEEMLTAVEEAKKIGASVVLIDRDIRITLQLLRERMTFREKIRIFFSLLRSLFIRKGELIELDHITDEDVLDDLVNEFKKLSPNAAKVLIDERDAYMAKNLLSLSQMGEDKKIVAVVGAGHEKGVKRYINYPSLTEGVFLGKGDK
ncbi:MAG: TraB family protein [Candidatus Methanolliviera sp. GoM_oil]|nr:MAG: TraB family protein [Candidatus Methanolliviera sp. GoM_oil]